MSEPSVLDVVKARLAPWRRAGAPAADAGRPSLPWFAAAAVGLGVVAQQMLESRLVPPLAAVAVHALAVGLIARSHLKGEIDLAPGDESAGEASALAVRRGWLVAGLALASATFLTCRGGQFTALNVTLWLAAVSAVLFALWPSDGEERRPALGGAAAGVRDRLARRELRLAVSPWLVGVVAVVLVSAFFRLYRIDSVPPEMISDHAEKLLDVRDVLDGRSPIFFARNGGREPMEFYLAAAAARYLGVGPSFLALKLLMTLAGLAGLVFMYGVGKEVGGRRVGLLTVLLCGVASWPNVLARTGLRLTLAPCIAAATLYFLLRGLRIGDRRCYLLAGLAAGLGMYGYTAFRIVPLAVALAAVLALAHRADRDARRRIVTGVVATALVALVVALPLARYATEYPAEFEARTLKRLTGLERPLPAPAPAVFFGNLGNALAMFSWSDGVIWSVCVPNRPALDAVTAVTLLLGCVLLVLRYARRRGWRDLFLIASIPVMLLPSALSLAFPGENPSPSRAGCAIVPVFVVAALGLEAVLAAFARSVGRAGRIAAVAAGFLLLGSAAARNYDLTFHRYTDQYRRAAWNSSEIGRAARGFADSVGTPDTVYVVGYPHWVDTRAVSFNAGFLRHDVGIWPDAIGDTTAETRAKLFILHPDDGGSLATLRRLYPAGSLSRHASATPGKDFLLYFVAPGSAVGAAVPARGAS